MNLKGSTMEIVGPTLGNHDYFAAVYVSKLSVGISCNNMNFLYRVRRGIVADSVLQCLIDIDAVQNVTVRLLAVAIERRDRIRGLGRVCRIGIAPRALLAAHSARIRIDRARHKQGCNLNVHPIHGHVFQGLELIEVLTVEFSASRSSAEDPETLTVVEVVPTCSFTSAVAI